MSSVRVASTIAAATAALGGLVALAGVFALLLRTPLRTWRAAPPALGAVGTLLLLLGAGLVVRAFRTF